MVHDAFGYWLVTFVRLPGGHYPHSLVFSQSHWSAVAEMRLLVGMLSPKDGPRQNCTLTVLVTIVLVFKWLLQGFQLSVRQNYLCGTEITFFQA